jgi:flagellar assembly factor FliW
MVVGQGRRVAQAETRQFGTIDYRNDETVEFPLGLPAFEQERKFLLIQRQETGPMVFLQSLGQPGLCFVTLPLLVIDPFYQLSVSAEDLRILGLTESLLKGVQPEVGREIEALAIMSVTNSRPTANLLAPVIINVLPRGLQLPAIGVQAIRLDRQYSHEHALGEPSC